MRISDIKTFLVYSGGHRAGIIGAKNWIFVKVETDEGIHGWGESYTQLDRDKAIEQHIHELKRYLVGRDPFNIKHITQMVYNDFAGRRGSMDIYCALSGIEQALWDIVGKKLNVPVYNLLGGACRDKVKVYANGWYANASTPDEYAEMAVKTVKDGFSALKFDPFPGPWRLNISSENEKSAVNNVKAVREAVGDDVDVLIDVHRRLAPMHAVKVGILLEEFNVSWYEEPTPSENIPALAEIRQKINIPIVTGEALYTKSDFRELFEQRAADIINPDVSNCGGILELKEIAAMAEPYYVAVSPHNYNSTAIGLAATVQVSACIPNFITTEYYVNYAEVGDEISVNPLVVQDGYISVPDSPGLGLELDEDMLVKHAYLQNPPRNIRQYYDEVI